MRMVTWGYAQEEETADEFTQTEAASFPHHLYCPTDPLRISRSKLHITYDTIGTQTYCDINTIDRQCWRKVQGRV